MEISSLSLTSCSKNYNKLNLRKATHECAYILFVLPHVCTRRKLILIFFSLTNSVQLASRKRHCVPNYSKYNIPKRGKGLLTPNENL